MRCCVFVVIVQVTKDHCLFDIQVEKDVECKVHREEAIRFYCEQCQSCICVLCTFQDHAGHAIFSFSEGIDRYSNNVRSLLVQARSRSQRLGSQLTALSRCEASLKAAEDAIRNTTMDLVSGVRRRERELLAQLRCVYDEGADGLTTQRESIADMLRNINATCDLADVLLQEKSVEFLLVHREISDKLSSVLQSPLKDLPDELLNRNIRFRASSKNVVEPVGFLHVSNSILNQSDDLDILSQDQTKPNPLPTDECVESNCHDPASPFQLKLECVCDRKPAQTSSADAFTSFDGSSCCLDRTTELMPRGRPSLRPPSPRGPDLWPPPTPPLKLRRRNQRDRVELWDSETETVALVTDTKGTSTVSISTVDRSTLTTLKTTCDRTTTTDWLVTSRDQETFTSPPILFNLSVQTDPPKLSSKCVQSHPETLNKLTMTRKPIQLERETNTPIVARFDCDVTARILGDDKSTSTRTIITVDTAVGCDDDLDLELVEEIDRNYVLRRGNRCNWKRSFDPESSSSSSSLFVQTDRRADVGLCVSTGCHERFTNVSTDDDDGYGSRMKLTSGDIGGGGGEGENFDCRPEHSPIEPSDTELMEMEKYRLRNQFEESSSTGIHWRDSSSSSVPSFSSSSLLLSSSSSRRVSPSSTSITDEFSYSAESVQRCNQLIPEQSPEPSTASWPRQNPTDLLPSSGFAEELSTLEENDDEELEDPNEPIVAKNIRPKQHFGNLPANMKPDRVLEHLPIVNKDRLSSAGESIDPIDLIDSGVGDIGTRKKTVQANFDGDRIASSATSVGDTVSQRSDERGANDDVGLQVVRGKQMTDGVIDTSSEFNTAQTKPDDSNPSKMQNNASGDNASRDKASGDNASRDNASRANASTDNASRDSDGTPQLLSNRVEDKSIDGKKDSDVAFVEAFVQAPGTDILRTVESKTPERATVVAGDSGIPKPPDITTDILAKDQISRFTESPVDSLSKDESNNTTSRSLERIATEKLDEAAASFPKTSPDKFVPSFEAGPSPETSRKRSKQKDQTELETTPTNANSGERGTLKLDLISETPILFASSRKKSSAASTPGSFPGVPMENAYTQLERLLPEIRAIATSLDCSSPSSSSSHSSLVRLLLSICSVLVKGGKLDFLLDETTIPLNSSETVEANGPSSNKNHHRPTIRSVFVDRAVSPVRALTRDSQTSTPHVPLMTQGSNTELALRVDIGVQSKHVSTCDRETSMLRTILLEKETSTRHIHLLHKNTSTDNQIMVDKQTTMTTDVKAAYLEATARPALTFSRGTCTPRRPTASDRASSPVRFSCVDKAVLATKGDALEPMDTFPGVGKSKARKPFVASRKAKLECISEGTIDEETEDSVSDAVDCVPSTLSSFRLKMVQRLTTISVQEKLPKSFAKRNNKFSLPVSPRPMKPFESSAFSFDVVESKEEEAFSEELMEELEDSFEIS